jgi:peptidoglycan hydrolase-like protein with peptidoglycan-binding domain
MNDYPKPKPRSAKSPALDETVTPEVEAEVEAEVVEAEAEVVEAEAVETSVATAPPTVYSVVSADTVDTVTASAIVYKNIAHKKSLSVHHLQRRLTEWGYRMANIDKDGYYGDPTRTALSAFQRDHGFMVTGVADVATLNAIFEGDTNVRVTA